MKLYLIQHGLASAKEKDPERPLGTQGEAQTQRAAEYLKSRSIKVDTIWHSRKLRAVQSVPQTMRTDLVSLVIATGFCFFEKSSIFGINANSLR
ncbi:MAG: histidine phosphatase family protein [Candidatus Aminicenantales bacterium]